MKPCPKIAIAGALALSLALTACGGEDPATSDAGGAGSGSTSAEVPTSSDASAHAHNDVDVKFAQEMIVHHRGALQMADLAGQQAESEQVRALAKRIRATQDPEIESMSRWLEAWNEPVPEGMSMGGMDHGDMGHGADDTDSMPGLMTEEQMAELMAARGRQFDETFLQMMIEHHRGAVEMAQTQQSEGENPEATALAERIETTQTQEVKEMQQLLQTL